MAKLSWYGRSFISVPVRYCLCTTEEQYRLAMKQAGKDYPNPFVNEGSSATMHYVPSNADREEAVCVVCIKPRKWCDLEEHYALLVHEAVHVSQEIMRAWGETNVGDETQAYFIQRISLDLMSDLEQYFREHPNDYTHHRKHHKKGTDVVRRRRRDNSKSA